jgi:ribose transport system substrate-binding protein
MRRDLRTVLIATAVAAVTVTAAACSSGGGGSTSAAGSSSASKSLRIGVSLINPSNPLFTSMRDGMQQEAKARGATLDLSFAQSVEDQTNQLNSFVTKQVDAVIASPLDASALVPAYQAVHRAGTPILSVANKVDNQYEDAYVGPDLQSLAKQTMEKLIAGIGGKGDIAEITGPPEIAFVQLQAAGWKQALAEHPDVHVAATLVDNDLSQASALDLANTAFSSHPGLKGVLASDDDVALGTIRAMQGHNIPPDQVFIAGWDGTPPGVQAIKDGNYDLTMSVKAKTWGKVALDAAIDWVNGKKPSGHFVVSPTIFIDKSNVNSLSEADIS